MHMTTEGGRADQNSLRREVGPLGVAATTINIVMGSGLFIIPATLGAVGGWAPVVIIACGIVMAAVTLCFAESSSRVPTVGGAYGFVGEALGPTAASIVGGQIWVSATFAGGAILSAAMAQVAPLAPMLGTGIGRAIVILSICTAFAAIARLGAWESARAVEVTIVLKIAPLLLFVAIVAFAQAAPPTLPQAFDLTRTAPLLVIGIYLFAGLESAMGINGEVRDPTRSLPIGLFAAIGIFAALAISIQFVAQHALGAALPTSAAPLVEAGNRANCWLGPVMAATAIVSMLGCVFGLAINTPRTIFALARDGMLPAILGRIDPKRETPVPAILLNATIFAVLAISGEFGPLATIATLASMSVYVLGCIATLVLRRRGVATAGPVIAWPITPLAAIVGIVANIAIIASSQTSEILGLLGSIILFALLAWFARRPVRAAVAS
ncbi:APC family permease [Sphingorhabdus sp.]|uniref:APC family permease n=1 Tax=Sphingorhabdus sp. TaxID=1902408 RepID=UPI0037C9DDA0